MQLIIGGAFSGKRKIVREHCSSNLYWLSAYDGRDVSEWKEHWKEDSILVLEGWEKWIEHRLMHEQDDDVIRKAFYTLFLRFVEEEQKRENQLILVMLEIGRGIVPIEKKERRLRDLAGWILQDATILAEEVHFVWHGLSKRLK